LSRAAWSPDDDAVRAHVGPAFVGGAHPLARVAGVTNGIVIDAERGAQCYTGPGAGPDVTAATLLDDVAGIVRERRIPSPPAPPARPASSVTQPDSGWFLRLGGDARHAEVADLLGSYGVFCTRIGRQRERVYALTCLAERARIHTALDALRAATGVGGFAFPAILEEAQP